MPRARFFHSRTVSLHDHVLNLFDLGVDLAGRPQPQVALAALKRRHIHHHHIADVEARFNLGIALARLGKAEDAAAQFSEAVKIKPEFAEARHALEDLAK